MNLQYSPYTLALLLTALLAGVIVAYLWSKRDQRGAIALIMLALSASIWSLGYALEIAGADLPTKLFWGKFQYFGITTVPLSWLIFALQYTRRDQWLIPRYVLGLIVLPVVTLILALTTETHGLIWRDFTLNATGPFLALELTHGPMFWVYWIFSQVLVLLGTFLMIQALRRQKDLFRGQAALILLAILIPWFGNLLYITGLNPIPALDLTPFAFTLSAAAFTWGIFRFHLIELTPVARDIVIETMPDGVIVLDLQGRIVDVNPAAQQMFRLTDQQLMGRPLADFVTAWPELVSRYQGVWQVQDELSFGEGAAQQHYEIQLSALRNRQGEIRGRVITVRDITQRKQAERISSQQAVRLATLYELSHSIVSSLDMGQVCAVAYQAIAHLMPTQAFFISAYDEEENILQDLYLFDKGQVWPNERTVLPKEGMTAQVIRSGLPLWIEDDAAGTSLQMGRTLFGTPEDTRSVLVVPLKLKGKVIGVISAQHYEPNVYTAEDLQLLLVLSNQVAIALENARLIESLRLQAAALDAAANAIVITDVDGIIRWLNPAFTTLTGYDPHEAIGQSLVQLLQSDQHAPHFYEQMTGTVLSGQVWQGILINRRKDGTHYTEQQTITPIRNSQGEIFRIISIKQDITELIKARDDALEADRFKSQLLATVSHELRTPLGAILGYAELLRDGTYGSVTPHQQYILSEIMESSDDLAGIVNDLLFEAQLAAQAIELAIKPFTIAAMLKKIEGIAAVLAQKKGLQYDVDVAPELPAQLMGDEIRLRHVLINLLGNAIKFTTKGSVHVKVFLLDPKHWSIAVSDTGPGMPPEALLYIFEPFRQVDSSAVREHRGTGLGLSIVKQLMNLMNGTIQVESKPGVGTTFTVTLPLLTVPEVAP